jgi:hypothetical protein
MVYEAVAEGKNGEGQGAGVEGKGCTREEVGLWPHPQVE